MNVNLLYHHVLYDEIVSRTKGIFISSEWRKWHFKQIHFQNYHAACNYTFLVL